MKTGPTAEKIEDRFWLRVNKHSGVYNIVKGRKSQCWLWIGTIRNDGYGTLSVVKEDREKLGLYNVVNQIASRVSYALTKGSPYNKFVLHHCDNPPCVRPKHLFKGTNETNQLDRIRKGRGLIGKKGIEHPRGRAKITENEVITIRKVYATRRLNQLELAKIYELNKVSISLIISGKNWSHLKEGL